MVDHDDDARPPGGPSALHDTLLPAPSRTTGVSVRRLRAQLAAGSSLLGGRLRVVRRIGEGGMGLVFEAHDERRRGSVALKTLSRLDAGDLYQLKNEFRSLADVDHVNLVRLHELFAEDEVWFFTMELVDGVTFTHWVRPDPRALDEQRLRAALPQLLAAIVALHAAGKLHRDLKPHNVLVTPHGRVVVLDFGLAIDPEPGGIGNTLQDHGVSGTVAYMAPEQAAGSPATAASDFYALGVMLFEALTGALPFEGRVIDVLVNKQRVAAPCVLGLAPNAPTDLAQLCDRLLERDPALRADVDALHECLGPPPIAAARTAGGFERLPMLGRERELAGLDAAYRATLAGEPTAAFVCGESGIGKSTLVQRFLSTLRSEGDATLLTGRCYERESVPFKGIDSVVDDLSRYLRKLSPEAAAALMPRDAYALARLFPVLERIEVVARAPRRGGADPLELRRRAFAAFAELLARIRDHRPLVLCIDDAQWLDGDASSLIVYLLGQVELAPSLLILSHRSPAPLDHGPLAQVYEQAGRSARLSCHTLELGPLALGQAEQLAAQLLAAGGPGAVSYAGELAAEASGNPFFVGELARQVVTSGNGARVTLHEAVQARALSLGSSAQCLLEVLAVAGQPLPITLALDASGSTHELVDVLCAERLLRSGDTGEHRSLECYHDKIRESLVQALSSERRRALHENLLATMLAGGVTDPEQLALHAEGAGDRPAAARYAEQAGHSASKAMAFEQALLFYERALDLGEYTAPQRRELGIALGVARANAGHSADAARAYLEAAREAGDEQAGELKRRAAEQLLISGHIDEGKGLLDEVLRAQGLALPRGPKHALWTIGLARGRLKLRGLASRAQRESPSSAERRELDVLWSAARGLAGVDFLSGAALSSRYALRALDSGLPDHAARALGSEAWFASTSDGASAKLHAEALLQRADTLARESARPEARAWVELNRGLVVFMQGGFPAARKQFAQVIEALREDCADVAFELVTAQMFLQLSSSLLGEFARPGESSALIEDAWRHGDLRAAILLTNSSALERLVRGDAIGVRRDLDRARRQWRAPRDYSWPDLNLLGGELSHALYTDEPERGLALLQADWPKLNRARLLRSSLRQMHYRGLRSGFALAVARRGGANATDLRKLVRHDGAVLARLNEPLTAGASQAFEAGLAFDRGEREQATVLLRASIAAFDAAGWLSTSHGLRWKLGGLLADETGRQMVASAAASLRGMGAVDLEATTRLFSYGCLP